MGKRVKKAAYYAKDFGRALLKEGLEGLYYGFYLITPPFIPKIFSSSPFEEFYSYRTFYRHAHSLYRKGYINKIGRGRDIMFTFNKSLRFKFLSNYLEQKIKQFNKSWDRKWRLLIYDIPDNRRVAREYLRRYLKNLGFGKVQHSCWMSAYNFSPQIHLFCQMNRLTDYICIYEGKFFAGKAIDRLVDEVWDLTKLHSSYKSIVEEANSYIRKIETQHISFKEAYHNYYLLFSDFKQALLSDPFLPKEFSEIWKLRKDAELGISKFLKALLTEFGIKV
jgi:DNA-binding transcriptional regulator PaaX